MFCLIWNGFWIVRNGMEWKERTHLEGMDRLTRKDLDGRNGMERTDRPISVPLRSPVGDIIIVSCNIPQERLHDLGNAHARSKGYGTTILAAEDVLRDINFSECYGILDCGATRLTKPGFTGSVADIDQDARWIRIAKEIEPWAGWNQRCYNQVQSRFYRSFELWLIQKHGTWKFLWKWEWGRENWLEAHWFNRYWNY